MEHKIAFTIGIPAYEQLEYTRQAIESCLNQNYPKFEIVICDDSRSDDVQKMINQQYSEKMRYFRNSPSLGLPKNSNRLLSLARHPWMLILSNDDLLEPDYLKKMNEVIQEHPDAALIRTRYSMIDAQGTLLRMDGVQPFQMNCFEFLSRAFLRGNASTWMSLSAVVFPTANLLRIGGFRDFRRGHHMDRVAWSELSEQGPVFFLQEPLAKIRSHRGEITTTLDSDVQAALLTNFEMNSVMNCFLDKMEARVRADEERALLKETRSQLEQYTRRQIGRALDQGIMAGIEDESLQSVRALRQIREQVKLAKGLAFKSYYFYNAMLMMPRTIRKHFVAILKDYKFKKWHS